MKRFWCLLLLTATLWAQPDGRKPIQDYYNGLSMASDLKFAEGMASHRTPDYESLDSNGRRSDRMAEMYRFRDLFQRSLSVKLTTKIVKFSQQGNTCRCLLEQTWEITRTLGKPPQTQVSEESRSVEDTWLWQADQWRLRRSVTRSAGLPRWR